MSNRKFAIKVLEEKGEVIISCNGNSMRPIIAPKEAIHLKKVLPAQLRVGDAVFCKINGNYQVHKVGAIDKERFRIENNKGHVNGWIGVNSIYGLAVQIEDRVLVSDEELAKRITPSDAQYLSGEPAPLKILVPIDIEEDIEKEEDSFHALDISFDTSRFNKR